LKSMQSRHSLRVPSLAVSTCSIADQKTQCWIYRQSIKGIRTRIRRSDIRARGFLVHYLALTFSTLLSSQVSGAHRAGVVVLRLGATRPTL
jgi:hypothetical protein